MGDITYFMCGLRRANHRRVLRRHETKFSERWCCVTDAEPLRDSCFSLCRANVGRVVQVHGDIHCYHLWRCDHNET